MFDKIKTFYGTSKPVPPLQCGPKERDRLYRRLRFQSFLAGTVSYSLYYVCRTTLNVVKKPIIDSHALDAQQLGIISSALLFAYAAGKFVNGLLPVTGVGFVHGLFAPDLPVRLHERYVGFEIGAVDPGEGVRAEGECRKRIGLFAVYDRERISAVREVYFEDVDSLVGSRREVESRIVVPHAAGGYDVYRPSTHVGRA